MRDNEVLPGESHYQEMYRKLTNQSLEYLHSNYEEHITRQPILKKIVVKWEEEGKEFDNIRLDQECKLVYVDMINHQRECEPNQSPVCRDRWFRDSGICLQHVPEDDPKND